VDLARFGSALRRYWWLALAGLVLGTLLGGYTFVRTETVYSSDSTIFVTQSGFPWGRTVISPETGESGRQAPFADTSRFVEVAAVYSRLASSDFVRNAVLKEGPIEGKVSSTLLLSSDSPNAGPLPLIRIRALATSPEGAVDLATRWTAAFRSYIAGEQKRGKIPASERVLLQPVQIPELREVEVAQPRSLTRPVAIVLAVLILALGLIFLLDNSRQRRLPPESAADAGIEPQVDGILGSGDEIAARHEQRRVAG
jgi:hypothetical protein